MTSRIRATGSYLPTREIRNQDLKQFPASAQALIQEKTGILARRYAADDECTSDLAAQAGRACLLMAGCQPEEVQAIIVATSSPDRMQPSTAARAQHVLGAKNAFAFDVNSVCTGAIYALELGNALVKSGRVTNVLILAAEVYSRILNPSDFSTCPYFGDGAGAALLEASERSGGILHTILKTDGSGHDVIQVPAGGTMRPYAKMASPKEQYFTMKGREVYDFAVSRGAEVIVELLAALGLSTDEVSHVIPHQANINIKSYCRSHRDSPSEVCSEPGSVRQHGCGVGPDRLG